MENDLLYNIKCLFGFLWAFFNNRVNGSIKIQGSDSCNVFPKG